MSLRMSTKKIYRQLRREELRLSRPTPKPRKLPNVQAKPVKNRRLVPRLTTKRPGHRAQLGQRPVWR